MLLIPWIFTALTIGAILRHEWLLALTFAVLAALTGYACYRVWLWDAVRSIARRRKWVAEYEAQGLSADEARYARAVDGAERTPVRRATNRLRRWWP